MKKTRVWKRQLLALSVLLSLALGAKADGKDGWICGPDGCIAAISQTEYSGWDAWRLCDGKTEAIIVPAIGRVMSFKTESGENWLWNADMAALKKPEHNGWKNWGGDKTWLSPQKNWTQMGSEKGWPPPVEWEQSFGAEVLSGGKLKIWSAVSPKTGLRLSRVFYHADNGDFVIEQTAQQEKGAPLEAGIWSVTQIDGAKIDAVFLPRGEKSDYDSGFLWLDGNATAAVKNVQPQSVLPTLLQIVPPLNGPYKFGVDSPRASVAAVRAGWAFVERAARPDGKYPDGEAGKSGTSVQLFDMGDAKTNYLELELLSPILEFKPGARWTHTVRWSLHELPNKDVNDAKLQSAVDQLLN